jgi:hypothetical protein
MTNRIAAVVYFAVDNSARNTAHDAAIDAPWAATCLAADNSLIHHIWSTAFESADVATSAATSRAVDLALETLDD